MTKKSSLIVALVALFVVATMLFAACGGTSFAIEWKVDEHLEVTVEGGKLPDKADENAELVFSVKGKEGYTVDKVVVNDRAVSADKEGNYKVKMTKDTSIVITEKEAPQSLVVSQAPEKLTYSVGEQVDKTGMVVVAKYASGDKTLEAAEYAIKYASGSSFGLGDTSFAVTFEGVTSEAVQLSAAVEVKVEINTMRGVVDSAWLTALQGNGSLHNFTSENNLISFTYSGLSSDIALPTATQITFGAGSEFNGWVTADGTAITSITAANKNSLVIRANIVIDEIVRFNDLKLVMKDGVPTLSLNVTLQAEADSVYLYFLEGNSDYRLKGDEVSTTTVNETIDVDFDLTKLSANATFKGGWMDIRFNAEIGGETFTQTFSVDHSSPLATVGQMIHDDNYCYRFITYRSNGRDDLKVYFDDYLYTYGVTYSEQDGNPILTFAGTLNTGKDENFATDFADGIVTLAFGSATATGTVSANGEWSAVMDLSTIANGFDSTSGAFTVTSADGTKTSATSATQLKLIACTTTLPFNDEAYSNPRYYSVTFTSSTGWEYTIGSDWTQPFLLAVDAGHIVRATQASLEIKGEGEEAKAYLVINGTYNGYATAEEAQAVIAEGLMLDCETLSGYTSRFNTANGDELIIEVDAEAKTFKIYVDISAAEAGDTLFFHKAFGFNGETTKTNNNLQISYSATQNTITLNGLTYTLADMSGASESWQQTLTAVAVTAAE